MKIVKIEKQLTLPHNIKELQEVSIQEGLQYKRENEGIRAIGPLYVLGSYEDEQGNDQSIKELIDMDVFAPKEKLSGEDFMISIGQVLPAADQNMLSLEIELQIAGLKEEQEEETIKESEQTESDSEDAMSILDDCFEDLFEEEATSYTTCRLVVAKANDTYASIAKRYDVDEKKLQSCNHDREIIEKTLVVLPLY
ncbi:LysM peptidoglycan-binding domain-containing protein [Merdibacter massiliensis]|uniref:LysM peptidoglycan-binding domain-containing protein n=1 Tax=Merdibacter massiliensis TaxID=1871030 RepID=UPI00096ABE27|nr:LysM peptidoglycan-binding domain-containing protein [Merdibacter massiliensis]